MLKFITNPSANKAPAASFSSPKFASLAGCKSAGSNSTKPRKSAGSSLRWRSAIPVTCTPKPKQIPEPCASLNEVIADVQANPKGLRLRYKDEYDSWRGMKNRRSEGFTVADEFMKFPSFLCLMGRKPSKAHTIDRIDPFDTEYALSKVRWADKPTQTRNRRCSIKFVHPHMPGMVFFAPQIAEMHGIKENTVRAHRRQGWTDHEIIENRRLPAGAIDCTPNATKDIRGQEARELAQAFVNEAEAGVEGSFVAEALKGRHIGQAKAYVRERGDIAKPVMMFAIANWIAFTKRAEIEAGAYRSPLYPSLDYFFRYEHVAIPMWRSDQQNSVTVSIPPALPKAATKAPVDHEAEYEEWLCRTEGGGAAHLAAG